jgi:TolB-like protein
VIVANVFLSHVAEDRDLMLRLAQAIEQAGFSTWYYERDCIPGPSYLLQTGEAVEQCDVFLVLVSPNSLGSHQVTREVVRAHESNKASIPVLCGVTHAEFQMRQPEWRAALGSATCVDVVAVGIDDAAGRVISGVRALGVNPKPSIKWKALPRHDAKSNGHPASARRRFVRVASLGAAVLAAVVLATMLIRVVTSGRVPDLSYDTRSSGGASSEAPSAATSQSSLPAIAVLEFDNNTSDAGMDVWKRGLREFVATDIAAIPGIRVVERARLDDVLAELALSKSDYVDPATAVRLGKGLSAHWVLTGSYAKVGQDVRLDMKLLSVERGTVEFASSASGSPDGIVALERTLVERLAAAIRIDVGGSLSIAALQGPPPNLKAFLSFSEALASRAAGDRAKAQEQLREALEADPQFALAAAELSSIENEALTVIGDLGRLAQSNASDAIKFLRDDVQRRFENIERRNYDGHYFADLLVVSAEMGLFGDYEREMAFLMRFWRDLADHVPADSLDRLMAVVNADIESAGKQFQKYIDSGRYGPLCTDKNSLRAGLAPDLQWPLYATFWPFSQQLRFEFGQIQMADDANAKLSWTNSFAKATPKTPLEYLESLLYDGAGHRFQKYRYHFAPNWFGAGDDKFSSAPYQSVLAIRLSVLRFYQLNTPPSPDDQKLLAFQEFLLVHDFQGMPLEKARHDVLTASLPVLRVIAASAAKDDLRAKAADTVLQVSRQLKLMAGGTADTGAARSFVGVPLESRNVAFILCPQNTLDGYSLEGFVTDQLVRALRTLDPSTRFNIVIAEGTTESGATAASDAMIAGTADNIAKAIDFVRTRRQRARPSEYDTSTIVTLEDRIGEILRSLPDGEGCDIVIVALRPEDDDRRRAAWSDGVSWSFIDLISRRFHGRVRAHAFMTERIPSIGRLVAASGGTASIFDRLDNPGAVHTASRWDVSGIQPRPHAPSGSARSPAPLAVALTDFELESRIPDASVRQHVTRIVTRSIAALDTDKSSELDYFVALVRLAAVAGKTRNRPLEWMLMRRWLEDLRQRVDFSEVATYVGEVAREGSDVANRAMPLLKEIAERLKGENGRTQGMESLWFPNVTPRDEATRKALQDLGSTEMLAPTSFHRWHNLLTWWDPYRRGPLAEELSSAFWQPLLEWHAEAPPAINSVLVDLLRSGSWIECWIEQRGGLHAQRDAAAYAALSTIVRILDRLEGTGADAERLAKARVKLGQLDEKLRMNGGEPTDLIRPAEYAPLTDWPLARSQAGTLTLFGRQLEARKLVVAVDTCRPDLPVVLCALTKAIESAGEGAEVALVAATPSGIEWWPAPSTTGLLDLDGRRGATGFISSLKPLATRDSGKLRSLLDNATSVDGAQSALVCVDDRQQSADAVQQWTKGQSPAGAMTTLFVMPSMNGRSHLAGYIATMRDAAQAARGTMTFVSNDWLWMYCGARPR